MYRVLISKTFQKQFHSLSIEEQQRIRKGLTALEEDPFTPRSSADIKPIQQTVPKKYRLRVGEFRIIYSPEKDTVLIIEVFRRGQGYSL
jgi:mRNA-degrading endonuclease RelE of RelBE toxin-antitoxin system